MVPQGGVLQGNLARRKHETAIDPVRRALLFSKFPENTVVLVLLVLLSNWSRGIILTQAMRRLVFATIM